MAGTRWAGVLAPVNTPTDDGRRFKTFSHRHLPIGLKWQRQDEPAHGSSVIVGSLDAVNIGTLKEAVAGGWISKDAAAKTKLDPSVSAVWGGGELFDDIDPLTMPRLAEDVAEAKLLTERGVIACSVDPIPVGPVFMVEPGQDEPPTEERWDEMYDEYIETGIEPPLEVLFSEGLIGAATLVVLPAFSEVRPFELTAVAVPAPTSASLVASLTAAAKPDAAIPADVFVLPTAAAGVYPITTEHRAGEGFLRVHGFVAAAGVCHVEFRNACVTAPTSAVDYLPFHRYPIDVAGAGDLGMVSTGRITTGYGKAGTGCTCCRGKDDHACNDFGLAATIAHYDQMQVLANVRAGHDEAGNIAVAGFAPLDLTPQARKVLDRQVFSGDWREYGGNLELVEVLALSRESAGYPIPALSFRSDGRQLSLTAAGAVRPRRREPAELVDRDALAKYVADRVVAEVRTVIAAPVQAAPVEAVTAAAVEPVHTGAMVALRMADADATRLAFAGGEPVDELHLTLEYLGEAADIPEETQQAIITGLTELAAGLAPVTGDAFAVSVFNPASDDHDTAIVLGIAGDDLTPVHAQVTEFLHTLVGAPDQHSPWVAHVTLVYSDDLSLVDQLKDRTGQDITFNRIRVAFAGVVTDIPLGASPTAEAAALAAEIEATDPDARLRAAEAAHLLKELELTNV